MAASRKNLDEIELQGIRVLSLGDSPEAISVREQLQMLASDLIATENWGFLMAVNDLYAATEDEISKQLGVIMTKYIYPPDPRSKNVAVNIGEDLCSRLTSEYKGNITTIPTLMLEAAKVAIKLLAEDTSGRQFFKLKNIETEILKPSLSPLRKQELRARLVVMSTELDAIAEAKKTATPRELELLNTREKNILGLGLLSRGAIISEPSKSITPYEQARNKIKGCIAIIDGKKENLSPPREQTQPAKEPLAPALDRDKLLSALKIDVDFQKAILAVRHFIDKELPIHWVTLTPASQLLLALEKADKTWSTDSLQTRLTNLRRIYGTINVIEKDNWLAEQLKPLKLSDRENNNIIKKYKNIFSIVRSVSKSKSEWSLFKPNKQPEKPKTSLGDALIIAENIQAQVEKAKKDSAATTPVEEQKTDPSMIRRSLR